MTRWKKEQTTVIREMLEHHRQSRWHSHVLNAAGQLGLIVGYRHISYRAVDGQWYGSRQWYVPTAQLETVGGQDAINNAARQLADSEAAAVQANW